MRAQHWGGWGVLIPPSIAMIIYAVSTNSSIGALFMAGVVPGIVLALLLGLHHLADRAQEQLPAPAESHLGRARQGAARVDLGRAAPRHHHRDGRHLLRGISRPPRRLRWRRSTPSWSRSCVYKDMRLRDVGKVLLSSANMSAMLLYIITNAALFSFLMSYQVCRGGSPGGCWRRAWAPSPSC